MKQNVITNYFKNKKLFQSKNNLQKRLYAFGRNINVIDNIKNCKKVLTKNRRDCKLVL